MEQRPPIWLIAILVVEVLFGLAFLGFGFSLTNSLGQNRGVPARDILFLSIPLLVLLGCAALSWWQWLEGRRWLALVFAGLPLLSVPLLLIVLGLAI